MQRQRHVSLFIKRDFIMLFEQVYGYLKAYNIVKGWVRNCSQYSSQKNALCYFSKRYFEVTRIRSNVSIEDEDDVQICGTKTTVN